MTRCSGDINQYERCRCCGRLGVVVLWWDTKVGSKKSPYQPQMCHGCLTGS